MHFKGVRQQEQQLQQRGSVVERGGLLCCKMPKKVRAQAAATAAAATAAGLPHNAVCLVPCAASVMHKSAFCMYCSISCIARQLAVERASNQSASKFLATHSYSATHAHALLCCLLLLHDLQYSK
jgi:hypothetical protein